MLGGGEVITHCEDCGTEFELDMQSLGSGYASWRFCPDCREAKAAANRLKLDAAKVNWAQETEGRRPRMPDIPNAPEMHKKCSGTTKAGAPCQARALPGSAYCVTHDPEKVTQLAEWRRQGGYAKASRVRAKKALPESMTVAELHAWLGVAFGKVLTGAMAPVSAPLRPRSPKPWLRWSALSSSSNASPTWNRRGGELEHDDCN